eukprot:31292_1
MSLLRQSNYVPYTQHHINGNEFEYMGTYDIKVTANLDKYYKKVQFSDGEFFRIFMLEKHYHDTQVGFHIIVYEKGNKGKSVKVVYTQNRKILRIDMEYEPGYYNHTAYHDTIGKCVYGVFDCRKRDSCVRTKH